MGYDPMLLTYMVSVLTTTLQEGTSKDIVLVKVKESENLTRSGY